MNLEVPYYSAEVGSCGLGCVSMLLDYYGVCASVSDLMQHYKREPYYSQTLGWRHQGLATILNKHGIESQAYRFGSLRDLWHQLKDKKPVIASLKVPHINNLDPDNLYRRLDQTKPLEGHLCLITGISKTKITLHDPRNLDNYGANVKLDLPRFLEVFTGNWVS